MPSRRGEASESRESDLPQTADCIVVRIPQGAVAMVATRLPVLPDLFRVRGTGD